MHNRVELVRFAEKKNKEKNLKLLGSCFPTLFFFFSDLDTNVAANYQFPNSWYFHITSQKIVEAKMPFLKSYYYDQSVHNSTHALHA